MVRVALLYLSIGLVFLSCHGTWKTACAQDFPYTVPKAPEFDRRGNYLGPGADPPPSRERSSHDGNQERSSRGRDYYTAVRPYAPQAPAPKQGDAYASQRRRTPPPQRMPASASSPAQMQPQMQQPPDCTGFPLAITRARSQGEMQMLARQYLTCLMKTGWPQEQARQQVIKTIESTYALTR